MAERSAEQLRARRLTALRRRLAHLEERINKHTGTGSLTYDRAEAAALRWALEILERLA